MPHYMQFMLLRCADHLVRFWLEAERFRSTSWSRVRAHSLNSVKHSSLAEPVPSSPGRSELLETAPHKTSVLSRDSSSEDPTVLSGQRDSTSEAGPRPGTPQALTPSRQAPSRTGTPYKVPSNSTLQDLSDKLMKSEWDVWLFVWLFVFYIICDLPEFTNIHPRCFKSVNSHTLLFIL